MLNAVKGELKIVLSDGVERIWRLNANDMAGIESVLQVRRDKKVSFMQFFGEVGSWGSDDFRLVLWAGLRHGDASLTEDRVGELFGLDVMFIFQRQFLEWAESMIPDSLKKKAVEPVNQSQE